GGDGLPSLPLPDGNIPNLPSIPPDVLPDVGGEGQDWGISEIDFSNQNPSLPTPTETNFPFPSELPSGISKPPSFSQGPGFSKPSAPPPISVQPTSPPQNNNNGSLPLPSINFSKMPARSRYMPQFNLSSVLQFDLKLGGFFLQIKISLGQILFFGSVIFLYFATGYLLDVLSKIDEDRFIKKKERKTEMKPDTTSEKLTEEEIKRKRERRRRLINFRDHIHVISAWVKANLDSIPPSELVIATYHKLDDAFAKFSKLKRDIGDTPLEHSHKHFEKGEINNDILEQLVHLFYYARYGQRELSLSQAKQMVDLLENLVPITDEDIVEEVQVIEE
ncbi:MAG: DUF4129 domain-containing protein, partial [Methanobacteriota archaeon]